MSRLYDTVEPAVIDDDMLQKAVEEQGPKEEAGKIARDEGIDFKEVVALRLDFKSKNKARSFKVWLFVLSFFAVLKTSKHYFSVKTISPTHFLLHFFYFRRLEN